MQDWTVTITRLAETPSLSKQNEQHDSSFVQNAVTTDTSQPIIQEEVETTSSQFSLDCAITTTNSNPTETRKACEELIAGQFGKCLKTMSEIASFRKAHLKFVEQQTRNDLRKTILKQRVKKDPNCTLETVEDFDWKEYYTRVSNCLLYTSDAADE